ncbi:hypothetical protein BZA05DRAFT_20352 [Tricharina praecox]|uniref:uncharacterized protein n=1 Tax=Tricharina praecox TaxID=43433 RepID=UPI002220E74D|nr:uncharacterized protein BZA05DRAFT_20352 [Tricharina praecox]KAI5859047.1 hypothetical protein BZA05DRAFT_20352 [Tricharina praecox]
MYRRRLEGAIGGAMDGRPLRLAVGKHTLFPDPSLRETFGCTSNCDVAVQASQRLQAGDWEEAAAAAPAPAPATADPDSDRTKNHEQRSLISARISPPLSNESGVAVIGRGCMSAPKCVYCSTVGGGLIRALTSSFAKSTTARHSFDGHRCRDLSGALPNSPTLLPTSAEKFREGSLSHQVSSLRRMGRLAVIVGSYCNRLQAEVEARRRGKGRR